MSLICDNYSVNQKVYKLLGGRGGVSLVGSTVLGGMIMTMYTNMSAVI